MVRNRSVFKPSVEELGDLYGFSLKRASLDLEFGEKHAWGWERVIHCENLSECGSKSPYAKIRSNVGYLAKEFLLVDPETASSIHFHPRKTETFYVMFGLLRVEIFDPTLNFMDRTGLTREILSVSDFFNLNNGLSPYLRQERFPSATRAVAVSAAADKDLTLSGFQTVGGVSLSDGDVCLARGQSAENENGPYVVRSGAWKKSRFFSDYAVVPSANLLRVPPVVIELVRGDSLTLRPFAVHRFRGVTAFMEFSTPDEPDSYKILPAGKYGIGEVTKK